MSPHMSGDNVVEMVLHTRLRSTHWAVGAWDSLCSCLLEAGTFADLRMGVSMAEGHGERWGCSLPLPP